MDEVPGAVEAEERLNRLVRALNSISDARACQACLNDLEAYVAAQLAGAAYATLFPGVAVHLDACRDCAAAYARLYDLEEALARADIPHPSHIPDPELGFLTGVDVHRAGRDERSLIRALRAAHRRLGDVVTFQLDEALFDVLVLPPSPTLGLRGEDDRLGAPILDIETPPIWSFHIRVYPDNRHPGEVRVEVDVAGIDSLDLASLKGIPVTLGSGDDARTAVTDDLGQAVFERVPIADVPTLRAEVKLPPSIR